MLGRKRNEYLALRRPFTPQIITLVVVAESPPASGRYFYDPAGALSEPLFSAMMKHHQLSPDTKENGLRAFQRLGWVLVDATYKAVNKLGPADRDRVIAEDYELLREDLAALLSDRSTPLLLIKANVCQILNGEGATFAGYQGCLDRRRTMSREELYALVWQTPMTKLAGTFGLSDVGLRKICMKHDIPAPSLGHWAKLAHGKAVHQPPLPPPPKGGASVVTFAVIPTQAHAPAAVAAQDAALALEAKQPRIIVPEERPAKLHPVAAATAKSLREAKADHEGFKHGLAPGGVSATVGAASIDRALCLTDAFAHAAEARGHTFAENKDGIRIVVDGVLISWRVYEIRDRTAHVPTDAERREQARRDADRAWWPTMYSSDAKIYRLWDYYPSGRLALTFKDASRFRWGRDGLVGSWHDRKGKELENYLDDAMAALAVGAVTIKQRLAEEAEKERREAEERDARRREYAWGERATERHGFVLKKAEDYARFEKLNAFAEYMEREVFQYTEEPVDRLIGELKALVAAIGAGLGREALNDEIARAQLYTPDDPIAEPADE